MFIKKPQNDSDIDGIIHELYRKHSAEYKRFITSTCSSTLYQNDYDWGDSLALINYTVKDNESYNSWVSNNDPNSNFSIYFLQTRIYITHYAFRSRTSNNNDMPKGWILEGSNDNLTWHFVDQKKDQDCLLIRKTIKTFQVDKPSIFRYFRFTQNQLNSNDRYHFGLNKVDFFGKTIDSFKTLNCFTISSFNKFPFVFSYFLCYPSIF